MFYPLWASRAKKADSPASVWAVVLVWCLVELAGFRSISARAFHSRLAYLHDRRD